MFDTMEKGLGIPEYGFKNDCETGAFWRMTIDLSILVPQAQSATEIARLLDRLPRALSRLPRNTTWELIIGCAPINSDIGKLAADFGAKVVEGNSDYGHCLLKAVQASTGEHVITMESGLAHSPFIVPELYARRGEADVLIASRFVPSGYSNLPWSRAYSSRFASKMLGWILDLRIRDFTSSFRLYRRRVLETITLRSPGLAALTEILVRAHAAGFRIREIPFHYFPTDKGFTATTCALARDTLRSLFQLWRLRNSIECADYDERAFSSRIWFQRSWQRKRYHALMRMAHDCGSVLDIGCGSSQVLDGLPQADGCDIRINKLRYKLGRARLLVRASVFNLPFTSNRYEGVIFSQVIEHLPKDPRILAEVVRVTKPGGYVIIGTPDYATWWPTIERIYGAVHPDGYADEHITQYTFDSLRREMEEHQCEYVNHSYVYGAELIMRFRKGHQSQLASAGANG